jgi:diguanylate cyclase (GGDEF)-like protein
VFALTFLDTRRHFPRTHRAVVGFIAVGVMLLTVLIAMDWQAWALLLTFGFGGLFAVIMVALGMISLRAGLGSAQYFLAASVCAMTGVVLTELSVWGVIPFTDWAYRAVEIGMLLDATLLALALTYQFRVARTERAEAQALARLDPLTGINNRRAFYNIAIPLWNVTQRHGRDLSILIMDIDRFKDINDTNGHACGDEVLRATTQVITETMRDQDVAARWGGEEFIVLLPETGLEQATIFAERLHLSIAASPIQCGRRTIGITASFGVAARSGRESSLDELITAADSFLLIAKHSGRNRVRPARNDHSESADAPMTP